jgi:hypothetical protein
MLARAADPALLSFVPSDSGVVIGLNVAGMRASSLGKTILSQANLDSANLKKLVAAVGFDPLHDLQEVLIAAPARKQGKGQGLFLLRGAFDPTQFAEVAVQPGMAVETWGGVQILTKKQDGPLSMACLDPSLIIGGDPESVRAAITNHGKGTGPDAELVAKAAALSLANDIWFASRVSPADLAGDVAAGKPGANPQLELMRSIEQASGGLKFGPDLLIRADLVTHTAKDAEGLAAAVRLIIGMAASSSQNSKETAAALQKLKLSTEGKTVKFSISIPEAEIAKAFQASMQNAMRQARTGSLGIAKPPAANAPARAVVQPKPQPAGITVYSSPEDMGVVTLPAPKQ